MSKKTFNLITGIMGGVATAACAVVTYFEPTYAVQIVAGIGIVQTAIVEVCSLFRKDK